MVCCGQSAVAVWLGAMSASNKLAAYPRGSATGRTSNSEYLLWSKVSHTGDMMARIGVREWSRLTT